MKTIKNIGNFTIQTRLYGKLIEIPANCSIGEEDFIMFDEKGRDEILRFLAIKLQREGHQIELGGFEEKIECPCCGKVFGKEKPKKAKKKK